jgi:hypothetical protein
MSPVRYELGFYIPEDDILHSHRSESLVFYVIYMFADLTSQSIARAE